MFGNKNKRLVEYINAILETEDIKIEKWYRYHDAESEKEGKWDVSFGEPHYYKRDYSILKSLKNRETIDDSIFPDHELKTSLFGNSAFPIKKPLRWCHAELAIIPTKRSLNVLFFETGDEDKNKEEINL